MIRRLILRDFQAHKKLILRLSPTVTTIVGSTDVGKSATLRGLKWCALNKPRGTQFLRFGGDVASVTLKVDGHKVTRAKGRATNSYVLDGRKFEAFGNEVPQEIAALLRLDDENFQGQHDSPFWFSEGASEVSRRLNRVVDLSLIDTTLSKLAQEVRSATVEHKVSLARLTDAKQERKRLKPAEDLDKDLSRLELLLENLANTRQGRVTLVDLVEKVGKYTKDTKRLLRATVAIEPDLTRLEAHAKSVDSLHNMIIGVTKLVDEIERLTHGIKELHKDLVQSEATLHKTMGSKCAFCDQVIRSSRS